MLDHKIIFQMGEEHWLDQLVDYAWENNWLFEFNNPLWMKLYYCDLNYV